MTLAIAQGGLLVPNGPGGLRQPRGLIQAEGSTLQVTSLDVETNTFYEADTFRVSMPIGALSGDRPLAWWANQSSIALEVFAGFPNDPGAYGAAELESLIYGQTDDISIDWDAGTLDLNGRDLTAQLIDTKTSEKYRNLTSSQIAEKLAAAHGLTPVVKATTTRVGRYYEIDQVRLQDERSEWDLLTWLAREEQFKCYVKGRELHFEPTPASGSGDFKLQYVPAAGGSPGANAQSFTTSRSLTLAKDIEVTVRSWNQKAKKGFTAVAKRSAKSGGKKASDPQRFSYTIANLTHEQAQTWANNKLAELSAHEMKLGFGGPATTGLGIATPISLTGTGTAFDQVYFPDSIARSLVSSDDGGGYSWTVQAKNHSPESEPGL